MYHKRNVTKKECQTTTRIVRPHFLISVLDPIFLIIHVPTLAGGRNKIKKKTISHFTFLFTLPLLFENPNISFRCFIDKLAMIYFCCAMWRVKAMHAGGCKTRFKKYGLKYDSWSWY